MLKKTIIALAFSSCFICMGQEKADVPQTPGDAEKEVVEVIDVNNTLQKIRAKSNLNKKGFTGISAADIGASPKTRQYVLNRSMAFAVAELNAKKIIAKSLQSSIATAMKNSSKINSDGLSADALGGDAELAKIVNEEIKKELLAKGVDINNPEAVKKAIPRMTETQSFKKRIEIASQAFLMGVSVYASSSSRDKVGVLVYSSKTLREIAQAMATGNFKKYAPGGDVFSMVDKISPKQMADTYGIRVLIDENGDPCLVAFAQMPVIGGDDASLEMADDAASALIREFAGMSLVLNNSTSQNRTIAYLQADDETDAKAVAQASITAKQEAAAEAERLDFSGITECKNGILRLPSGDKIAYSIKYWTPTAARDAAKAHKEGEQQQKNLQDGVHGGNAPAAPAPAKTNRKDASTEGTGFVVDAL